MDKETRMSESQKPDTDDREKAVPPGEASGEDEGGQKGESGRTDEPGHGHNPGGGYGGDRQEEGG
jgi:hypothetical protein